MLSTSKTSEAADLATHIGQRASRIGVSDYHVVPHCRGSLRVAILLVAVVLSLVDGALGQPPRLVFSDSVEVHWVFIPVVVEVPKRRQDLRIDDFQLAIDGNSVVIETFEDRRQAAMSLVFMQDLSGSMENRGRIAAGKKALELFAEAKLKEDEIEVVTFGGGTVVVQEPFTSEAQRVLRASTDWAGYGTTALHDAVTWLPDLSLEAQRLARAAVLITDGRDNSSHIEPDEARRRVGRTQLPVYAVDLSAYGSLSSADNTHPAGTDVEDAQALRALALGTGGRYYQPRDELQFMIASREILSDLKRQYVLGFVAAGSYPEDHHKVEVAVKGRKVSTRYRPSYYGPPPLGIGPPR